MCEGIKRPEGPQKLKQSIVVGDNIMCKSSRTALNMSHVGSMYWCWDKATK